MASPLLIAATQLEATPLLQGLYNVEAVAMPIAKLYHGYLDAQSTTPIQLAILGVAKVNTAAGLSLLIDRLQPEAVMQFGIGGAFVGSSLQTGSVVVAREEVHIDTGVRIGQEWQDMQDLGFPLLQKPRHYNRFVLDTKMYQLLEAQLGTEALSFATSETITGDVEQASLLEQRFKVSVESMEGAAAAQVCAHFQVPFAELRGISNVVGERDKNAWNIPLAVEAVCKAVKRYLRTSD